jgi:hypothetical protein
VPEGFPSKMFAFIFLNQRIQWSTGDKRYHPKNDSNVINDIDVRSKLFLISNFRPVLNGVCFHLGNSPASGFYVPTFLEYSVPS